MERNRTKADTGIFASCSFADLGLHPTLCQHLQDKMGFQVPTQIQAQAIPVVVSGKDVLVNAATGTGKTIVYLAPIVHLLKAQNPRIQRSDGTFGISILIATPGRLLDHLKNTSSFIYSNLRWIVFDEADRILELGFGKAIEEILDFLGSRKIDSDNKEDKGKKPCKLSRQNLLLSATLNEKVNHLANISLLNPMMVGLDDKKISSGLPNPSIKKISAIESDGVEESECPNTLPSHSSENYNLPTQLIQSYAKVPCGSRLVVLFSILKTLFEKEVSQKIVVFLSTCDAVDFHYFLLNEFRWSPNPQIEINQKQTFVRCRTFRLNGNMDHDDRRAAFHGFKSEKSALLLCTDVAARGLDLPKVRCIIQYDSPGEASEYVHRVGRTARLGEKGEALLFLQPTEIDYLNDLQRHGVSLKEYPLDKVLDSFPLYGQKRSHKNLVTLEMHPWVLFLQKALENFISAESKLHKLANDAFCSWIRAYTAHRGDLKRIFMVKNLHLGHVARSFGLKDRPSLVGRSFQMQVKKRKRDQRQVKSSKRRRILAKGK